MNDRYDTIVLGGGASGMAAAISASEQGSRTLLIEKSGRLGRKVSASGNGRCNLMNTGVPKYYGEPVFAETVLKCCTAEDLTGFFRKYGLYVKEEREGRVYPATMQAISVNNALQNALKINQVSILLQTGVAEVLKTDQGFVCRTDDDRRYFADRLIVCTGGAAQSRLGGSYDGYRYLQSLGHQLRPVFPSLVPVMTDPKSISGLAGIRTHCSIALMDGQTILHQEEGELLFTEYGLSGICVMQCSRHITRPGLHFEIDYLSSLFSDPNDALKEMLIRQKTFADFPPVLLLEGILLPRLSYAVLKQAGIPLRGEKTSSLTGNELESIVKTAYRYKVNVTGTKTLDDAQVTAGGIRCDDFDPHTMESKRVPGLLAAGEVLNVDGDCGGFNLMFAFASGLIAGGFRKTNRYVPEEAS